MKIKYKLILIFIFFTIVLITPFFSIIIKKMETETLGYTISQSQTNSRIFARSVLNILMMNGGDIRSSSVDIKDMTSMLEPLMESGLVYADAVLLSTDPDRDGTVLASLKDKKYAHLFEYKNSKADPDTIRKLIAYNNSYREFTTGETYLEFISAGNLPGQPPFCIVRMVISKTKALQHITSLKFYVNITILCLIIAIVIFAFIFGEYLSRPVIKLTDGAKKIESGDYRYKVDIRQSDEIGNLAVTFNKMASMINLKITELEQANEELTRMDRLKDEFLANTSHELKTPVHGILGLTESLIDGSCGDMNPNAKQILTMILQSSRRLVKLVNDIIDFSKLKSNNIRLKKTSVDLGSMAETVITQTGSTVTDKDITLINEIRPGRYFVLADEERLKQIFLNLAENAVKFTEKGAVNFSASTLPSGEYKISISDTGIGIPEDKQKLIFDSFFQSDGTAARKYGGTGLGLSITKDLVELHGGRISFTSKEGEGSTFSFTLQSTDKPFSNQGPDTVDRFADLETKFDLITDISAGEMSGARVMIVDDDIINLQLLLNQLTKEGYSVTSFTGGEKALESIQSGEKYDIILLDVMMPVISGYEVCSRIREKFTSHELPVIMLTARNTPQDIITGINLGANDYITKPFDRDVLLSRVRSYISLKKAVEEQAKFIEIKQELQIAKKIQLAILPDSVPNMTGLTIRSRYEPMREIGGDFYDFLQPDDRHIGILIADVTGHGVPAALISSMVKISYYMSIESIADPAALLEKMNSALINHIYGRYITAFYAFIDLDQMKMTFSNAAHWPMYIQNRGTGEIRELTVKGRLIGLAREQKYNNLSIDIKKGDRIVFFTDGIVEQKNAIGELLDEENLERIIRENSEAPVEKLIDSVFSSIYDWADDYAGSGLDDDATMLVVDIG